MRAYMSIDIFFLSYQNMVDVSLSFSHLQKKYKEHKSIIKVKFLILVIIVLLLYSLKTNFIYFDYMRTHEHIKYTRIYFYIRVCMQNTHTYIKNTYINTLKLIHLK